MTWQRPGASVAGTDWDAIVVGAGPAGAVAAKRLAERGRRVLLVERHAFPRDKACGDALMPDAVQTLRRNGLLERATAGARAVATAVVYSPSRIRFAVEGSFLCVKRRVLDAALAQGAAVAGAVCCRAYVRSVRAGEAGGVRVSLGTGAEVRARVAIVATGADVSLLEPHGMVERKAPSAVAIRCYVRSRHDIDALVFSLDRSILPGYAWIFPVGDAEYNVGCGVFGAAASEGGLRAMLERFLAQFPAARELMRGATDRSAVRGARLRCGLVGTRATGGVVIAAGESIGATFPFTGEGIGKAMETAELAADAVDAVLGGGRLDGLAAYARRMHEELRPKYLGYEVAERWLSHRWLADLLAHRAKRSARVRRALRGLIDETVDPRRIFSVRGLLTSLVG